MLKWTSNKHPCTTDLSHLYGLWGIDIAPFSKKKKYGPMEDLAAAAISLKIKHACQRENEEGKEEVYLNISRNRT